MILLMKLNGAKGLVKLAPARVEDGEKERSDRVNLILPPISPLSPLKTPFST